jgi:hypothetical protein
MAPATAVGRDLLTPTSVSAVCTASPLDWRVVMVTGSVCAVAQFLVGPSGGSRPLPLAGLRLSPAESESREA